MNKLKKIITLGLLLPIFMLNLESGPIKSCPTDSIMQHMDCCVKVDSFSEIEVSYPQAFSCSCQTKEMAENDIPLAVQEANLKFNIQKIDKRLVNISPRLTTISDILTSSLKYYKSFHEYFSSDLKIYDINSAYLI